MAVSAPTSATGTTTPAPLQHTLARVTRRVRLLRAVRFGATGLLAGAFLTFAALLLFRLRVLDPESANDTLFPLPPLVGLLIGAIWGATRPVPPLAALRLAEQRLDLKERLSTAYTLAPSVTSDEDSFAAQQIADASRVASSPLDMSAALPWRPLPRVVWAALSASLAAFLMWFLPTLPFFQSEQERAEHAAVKKEGERLVRIAKALEAQAGAKKMDKAKRAAAQLTALAKEMQKGKMSQRKAMMKTAKLTEEMKQAQQAMANQTSPQKSLNSASKDLAKAMNAAQGMPKLGEENKNQGLKAPENSPNANGKNPEGSGKKSPGSEEMRKMLDAMAQNDVPSLSEQLAKLADKVSAGEPKNEAERKDLAEKLAALSKALEKTSLSKASEPLQKASDALKNGNMAEAEKQLREAARRAAESKKQGEESKALQQMADALSGANGESSEGQEMSDNGEGEGANDAFGKDGSMKGRKGHVHTAECLKPGGACYRANGGGQGKGSGNGIGSGAGKLGGPKPKTEKWSPYLDAKDAPKENKFLNRKTQNSNARDDNFSRLYAGQMPNTRVTGKRGEKGKETISYFRGAPDKADAKVPYYEVYGQYAPAAESALNREDIPTNYKKQVKDYFEALNPSSDSKSGGKGGQ
jgi:hypothetical protein